MKTYNHARTNYQSYTPLLKPINSGIPGRDQSLSGDSTRHSASSVQNSLRWYRRSVAVPVWAAMVSLLVITGVLAASVLMLSRDSADPVMMLAGTQENPALSLAAEKTPVATEQPEEEEIAREPASSDAEDEEESDHDHDHDHEHDFEIGPSTQLTGEPYEDPFVSPGLTDEQADEAFAEIEGLRAELESIQRSTGALRSLTRQQADDLSEAYSSLESTQEQKEGAVDDFDSRLDGLEERLDAVDELATNLRELLDMAPQEDLLGAGGPSETIESEDLDDWTRLRADILNAESRAGELSLNLDEVGTELQVRLWALQSLGVERTEDTSEDLDFYEQSPVGWPIDGPVTSRFGVRSNLFQEEAYEMHTGIDVAVPVGSPVRATGNGVVRFAGTQGGYGMVVIIDHGRGISTLYGHNSSIAVSAGEEVSDRQVIASAGSTGYSTGPHVHYEVRIDDQPVDPEPYMSRTRP